MSRLNDEKTELVRASFESEYGRAMLLDGDSARRAKTILIRNYDSTLLKDTMKMKGKQSYKIPDLNRVLKEIASSLSRSDLAESDDVNTAGYEQMLNEITERNSALLDDVKKCKNSARYHKSSLQAAYKKLKASDYSEEGHKDGKPERRDRVYTTKSKPILVLNKDKKTSRTSILGDANTTKYKKTSQATTSDEVKFGPDEPPKFREYIFDGAA